MGSDKKKDNSNERAKERKKISLISFIKKVLPGGGYTLMQFISKDLSLGGIFIITEDLSIFDLGEELEILLDEKGNKFYEGRVKVVRSTRAFSDDNQIIESGFGLMFQDSTADLAEMLKKQLAALSASEKD